MDTESIHGARSMAASIGVLVRLPEDELRALDSYRREQDNPPSRPDALRQLARAGGLGCRNGSANSDHGLRAVHTR
jgi:hypothetical protein